HGERSCRIFIGVGGAFHGHIHRVIGLRDLADVDAGVIVLDLDRVAGRVGCGIAAVNRRGVNTGRVVHRAGIARIILLGFGDKLFVRALFVADLPAEIEGTAGAAGSHPGTRFGRIGVILLAGVLRGFTGSGVFFEGDAHACSVRPFAVLERVAGERSIVGLPAVVWRDGLPAAVDI